MSSIPATMNAITFKAPGDPNVLELVNVPVPDLKTPYDILVQIKGSALNPVDYKVSHHECNLCVSSFLFLHAIDRL